MRVWLGLCRGSEETLEFGEFGWGSVGYRPEAEVAVVPGPRIIALAGQGFSMVGWRDRQHEKVDHVLAALVDERRDRFARDQVEPPADQREACPAQFDYRRRQIGSAGKPRL